MTASMRAMPRATTPKALRIGLVVGGRILEERIIRSRAGVTVGSDEKAMFVVDANVPPRFELFEWSWGGYTLNVLGGMTGRVALSAGVVDLATRDARALRLTEDARGKIVVGKTTFLFQFVPLPPLHARPRLPLAVKNGVAGTIDWRLTVIAAFSFLLHFGFAGAMYSDWMDTVVNDDITAGLVILGGSAPPPPVETTADAATAGAAPTETAPAGTTGTKSRSSATAKRREENAPDARAVDGLLGDLDRMSFAVIGGMAGGPNIRGVMTSDDNGAPVDLNGLWNREEGIDNSRIGLNLPTGGGAPIHPGQTDLRHLVRETATVSTSAGPARRVDPGEVQVESPSASVPVSNAEAVIRSQIHPGARRCYQKGLELDPSQAGKLVIVIRVAPSGEVESATVSSNAGLSAGVASCVASVAHRARFEPTGRSGATIVLPFNFLQHGG
jgi:hypothetical protein